MPIQWFYLEHIPAVLRRSKRAILVAAGLFGIGLVLGLAVALTADLTTIEDVMGQLMDTIKNMISEPTAARISLQNIRAVLVVSVLSVVTLGIAPVAAVAINGLVIGFVLGFSLRTPELGAGFFLAGVLPHGVIEIPAFLLGLGMALRLAAVVFSPFPGKTRGESLKQAAGETLSVLALVVPLLLMAATIEATVTPKFLSLVMKGR